MRLGRSIRRRLPSVKAVEYVPFDPEIPIGAEPDRLPRGMGTWRAILRGSRVVRRESTGFAYQASANAVGTLAAIAIAYLVSVAAGIMAGVPVAVVASVLALIAACAGLAVAVAPKNLLAARASELLDREPGRIVSTFTKIFAGGGDYVEWDILDAVERLPEPQRTIIVVRFGEPMTLERIADALGLSSVQVLYLESAAVETVRADVGAELRHQPRG